MISRRPEFDGVRFANLPAEKKHGFMLQTFLMYCAVWRLYAHKKHMESWVLPELTLHKGEPVVSVYWLGHASVLIDCAGFRILIDPAFFNLTPFFRRITPVEHLVPLLPPIDVVLISHNHWDHADRRSLRLVAAANPQSQLLVPTGDGWWGEKLGFAEVRECGWGDSVSFAYGSRENLDQITISFLPARHWSQCTPFNRNHALWGSWMVQSTLLGLTNTIYHAGDTAPWDHFTEIATVFPTIDVACMPIGPCEPRKWLAHSHLGPEEAGEAAHQLGARILLPIHWGTYWFGVDSPLLPFDRLIAWQKSRDLDLVRAPKIGEPLIILPNS